ncbi:carboxypeptidase regulatory-like domain-containing protein [Myxococcaceae bacterium JPH2]|nr:carboxypeptidase regulatory-like domain-containing protein [Myxococcaceae bacterium JPH2]
MKNTLTWAGISAGAALVLGTVAVLRVTAAPSPAEPAPPQAAPVVRGAMTSAPVAGAPVPSAAAPGSTAPGTAPAPDAAPSAAGSSASAAVPTTQGSGDSAPLPVPSEPPTLEGTATVRVRVLSAQHGTPVANAKVAILRGPVTPASVFESVQTDEHGQALFSSTHAGLFDVCARGPGHAESCESDVGVVANGTLSVELRLPPGASLSGRVTGPDGAPAADVRVVAWGDELFTWRLPMEAVSDAQGAFRIDGLTPGKLHVSPIAAQGQGMEHYLDAVAVGTEGHADLQLAGFTPVTVRLARRAGKVGLKDTIESVGVGDVALSLQPDGTWRGSVESGKRQLWFRGHSGGGVLGSWQEVTLKPGVPFSTRIAVTPDPTYRGMYIPPEPSTRERFDLAGYVVLPGGTLAHGVTVAVEQPISGRCGDVPRRYTAHRFEGGGFVVHPLSGSPQTVYAWLPDGRAGSVTLTGKPGEHLTATIRLEETGAVAGSITLGPESRMEGPPSIVIDDRWHGAWQFTQADGSFLVAGLTPGEHTLYVKDVSRAFTVKAGQRTELGALAQPAAEARGTP